MGLKKEYANTIESIKIVMQKRKYKLVSLIFGFFSLVILYYLLVAKVADKSIWISVMMSGSVFITASVVNILIISALSGILFSMLIFKFRQYKALGNGSFGFVGSGITALGVGCPTCGAFLFGLLGMPLALMYLPFKGVELQILGILILLISIYLTGNSINSVCKIKIN